MKTDFTFGFEIEGIFSIGLPEKLQKFSFSRKSDGSVHSSDIIDDNRIIRGLIDDYTEYNVGIFKNKEDLLNAVRLFENGKNYFMDTSCGLHLHIKPKDEKIKELFWDLDFISKLENFAFKNLCECQKKRYGNRFCEVYTNLKYFISDIKNQEKYRFVRNHPSGTLEFRFFSPCPHKAENIEKFLNYMFRLLEKQEPKKKETIEIFEYSMPTNKKDFSFSINLNNNKDYEYKLGVEPEQETRNPFLDTLLYPSVEEDEDEEEDDDDREPADYEEEYENDEEPY